MKMSPKVQAAINFLRDPSGDGSTKVSHGWSNEPLRPVGRPTPAQVAAGLTEAQRIALVEADDGGYRATGAGRMKTARALHALALVDLHSAGNWTPGARVTITPRGREVLHAIQPAGQAPGPATTGEKT